MQSSENKRRNQSIDLFSNNHIDNRICGIQKRATVRRCIYLWIKRRWPQLYPIRRLWFSAYEFKSIYHFYFGLLKFHTSHRECRKANWRFHEPRSFVMTFWGEKLQHTQNAVSSKKNKRSLLPEPLRNLTTAFCAQKQMVAMVISSEKSMENNALSTLQITESRTTAQNAVQQKRWVTQNAVS
jgi:hypothetical protein